jgi:hypothetical protein
MAHEGSFMTGSSLGLPGNPTVQRDVSDVIPQMGHRVRKEDGMKKRLLAVALTAVFASIATSATAGQFTFHPSGFGPKSYGAWKAQQGLADSRGNDYQAFYLQKMVPTTTVAAGVALIKGFEGLPAEELDGLEWKHRTDGHCGAGAPRWNVNLVDESGQRYTAFFGCFAAAHSPVTETDPGDHTWCRDTYGSAAIGGGILAQTGQSPADLEVRNIAIVFDEGPEVVLPEPPGCPQDTPAGGFVYLDDITVVANGVTHVWTGANDNGNGGATTANTTMTAEQLRIAIDAPLSSLLNG